jgi:pyruvate/2-oxoglutarate/acetoin dehydrogenase E1 component
MDNPCTNSGPNGAAAGVGAQHSQDFASWYSSVPGLKVKKGRRVFDEERSSKGVR